MGLPNGSASTPQAGGTPGNLARGSPAWKVVFMSAISNLPAPLSGVLRRYRNDKGREPVTKRKPGRPRTRDSAYFAGLLVAHEEIFTWYASKHGCTPSSDRHLYTEYFAQHFEALGERASKSATPLFQRSIKTLRNELSEARRRERARPPNPAITGTVLALS